MAYWLFKTEPGSWSWDDQVKKGVEHWNGVRNHQAANNMKAMKIGELGFFYHSVDEKRIVGIVEVAKEYYPDHTDASGRFELPANLPQDATLSVLGGALTRTVQESASNADFLVDAHVVVFRVERLPGGRLGGGRWAWTALRSQIQVVGTGHGYGELDSDSVVVRVPDGATWVHLAAQSPGHEMATDLVRISGAPRVHHEKCHVRPLADDRAGTIVLHPVDPFGGEPGVLIVSVLEGLTGLPYDGWISREVTAEAGQGIRLEGIPADGVLVRAEQAVAEPGTSLWVPTVAVVRVEAGRSHEVECRMRIGGRVNLFVDEARLPGTRLHELQLWDRRGKPVMIFGVAGSEGPIAAWDLPGRRPVQDAGISRGWSASFLALPGEYVLKVVPSASADARPTREFEITVKEAEVVELELK